MAIASIFKSVERKYDPYRRRTLKKIFKLFNKDYDLEIDAVSILKYIENLTIDHEIPELLKEVRSDS